MRCRRGCLWVQDAVYLGTCMAVCQVQNTTWVLGNVGSQVQHAVLFGIIGCLSGHVDLNVDQGGKICVAALSRPH